MSDKVIAPREFLRRWSKRKLESARAASSATPVAPESPSPAGGAVAPAPQPAARAATAPAEAALPALDSLTFDSDFTAFLQPKIAEGVKRAALKKLFRDPRFNVMDGLDVYIDDYTIPSPLEPGLIEQLAQARYILNPPSTRVTAVGYVEDVPEEDAARQQPGLANADPHASPDLASVCGGPAQSVPAGCSASPEPDIAPPAVAMVVAAASPQACADAAASPQPRADAAARAPQPCTDAATAATPHDRNPP